MPCVKQSYSIKIGIYACILLARDGNWKGEKIKYRQ